MKQDEIEEQYIEKEEIDKIIELIKSYKKIIKTPHFYKRIYQRDISEELIDETFPCFDKVKLIDKRKHEKGDIGYDLYYELSKKKTLKLCFILLKEKLLLVNAILRDRRWQGSIRIIDKRA